MVINVPSLANISLLEMESKVQQLVEGGVRCFHVDIMDGHYVPNLCFPPSFVRDLKKKYPHCMVEVHLMAENPMSYFSLLGEYGADCISFHLGTTPFTVRALTMLGELEIKAGVVLNPSQPVEMLEPFAHLLDYVVFMSVEPGYAGQRFLPGAMERLAELSDFRRRHRLCFQILVDGGVSYEVADQCIRNGADMLVTGIYMIFDQPDGIVEACKRFEEAFGGVRQNV
ncbi:ribulose-phosphate 3-epimerase [Oscillospiraceae bacterium MB08-C2-2]|nr:ribulose-phosphate 3-epimerase [Oscillospiraceae bacterium MB08-C2-2]